jgi:malonyl-CoA/methylmalonyl-CoA synthetase
MIDAMPGVFESAVFGVPHPDFGEAVIAAVVRRQSPDGAAATETGIVNALKGALANFKVLKRVHFIDELPCNSMGKVQKKVLRDQYA